MTLRLFTVALVCLSFARAQVSDLLFVDGTRTRGEILFKHPNADLLIVRSEAARTLQSIALSRLQATRAPGGQLIQYTAARELSEAEKVELSRNGLWGDEAAEGQLGTYATETWESRPVRVWAFPGESGDAFDPEYWLDEKGNPVTESPWTITGRDPSTGEFDGDILLPAAEKPYTVIQSGNRDHLGTFTLRHLTVEKNATYHVRYHIEGNLWVKDKGSLSVGVQTGGLGSRERNKHTFARFCHYHDVPEPHWANTPPFAHWGFVDAGKASLEIIGHAGGPSDRFTLSHGTLVISKNSSISNGNRGCFFSHAGTTVVLLDGSRIGAPDPLTGGSSGKTMATYGIGGTLLFGHPEKPLTRDLEFSATYYALDGLNPNAGVSDRTSGGSFVLGPQGRMVVHSIDPSRARVIFRPRDRSLGFGQNVVDMSHGNLLTRQPNGKVVGTSDFWELPMIPKGVSAVFHGETDFNGVVFDGFYKGGIVMHVDKARAWRNVSFGPDNHGPPHSLFARLPDDGAPTVRMEPQGGIFPGGQQIPVTLQGSRESYELRYTLDGTVPDRDAPRYTQPLTLTDSAILTVGAFLDQVLVGRSESAEFHFQKHPNHAPLGVISSTGSFGSNPIQLANDLNPSTYWRGGTQSPQHVQLEWEEPVVFNRVNVTGTNVEAWTLQAEVDGQWVEVSSGKQLPLELATKRDLTTQRVRFVIESHTDRPVIHEIEILHISTTGTP